MNRGRAGGFPPNKDEDANASRRTSRTFLDRELKRSQTQSSFLDLYHFSNKLNTWFLQLDVALTRSPTLSHTPALLDQKVLTAAGVWTQ